MSVGLPIEQIQLREKRDYDSLFPFVSKPSRYIGGEWNSIAKPLSFRENAVGLCLCFPDLYETGFANMGLEILYQIVNKRNDSFAERAFVPDTDLAGLLRQKKWPLFSLESQIPLDQFDLLGFGLPYELCYTNILETLDLAGIPLRSSDRTEQHPIVVGGGPCAVNPEPIADFFDCFVIGDGEEVIGEMIDAIQQYKNSFSKDRGQLLLSLAKIRGVYVPSLYQVTYQPDGVVESVLPKFSEIPEKVSYRQIQLESLMNDVKPLSVSPVVPFLSTVHDRLNVEIQRGCPWRCRFCQIGFSSHAYREKSKESLIKTVTEALKRTGYDAVTLSGLSAADHSEIVPMIRGLAQELTSKRISIGLPSTRADRFSLELAELLQSVRRQTLTFAPEAGSERLRKVIRKDLRESEIRQTLKIAFQHGWKAVKLYFMYGLPTETEGDIQGIVELIKYSRKENPGLSFTCTLSPCVPKPHTPFQWHVQQRSSVLRDKLVYLKKHLSAQVRAHDLDQIELEGLLSRGDRRCSWLIQTAWLDGAKFDGWTDRFRYDLWQKAYSAAGLTPEFFCYRERSETEVFPWDHIEGGPEKNALWNDYQNSLKVLESEPVPVNSDVQPVSLRPSIGLEKAQKMNEQTITRLRFKMGRSGSVRFLSHLEQIEMIRRALRRSELPVTYTQGFHPQMKCSFGPAISVGYESECEYFDVDFSKKMDVNETSARLAGQLVLGFSILSVVRIPVFFPSLESLINRADYEITVSSRFLEEKNFNQWQKDLEVFLDRRDMFIEKVQRHKNNQIKKIFVRDLIREMKWKEFEEQQGAVLFLSLKLEPGKNLKPEKIASLFLDCSEDRMRLLKVKRRGLYTQKEDGSFLNP